MNEDSKSDLGQTQVIINGEPLSPNESVTGSQTENVKVTITEGKQEPEDTPEDTAEKPPVLEVDHSYAHELAGRIIRSARGGKLRKVGVAQKDFERLVDAGFIKDGLLRGSSILVLIQVDADTTNTYWDRTGE